MNEQENVTITDLEVNDASEVKGGPKPQDQRTIVLRSSVVGEDEALQHKHIGNVKYNN
jgi:hypothetical protein